MDDKPSWNLVHRESLLQQMVDQLRPHEVAGQKLSSLEVSLFCGEVLKAEIFSVAVALDYLVNDIYWSGEDDWQFADKLTVEIY